MAKNRQDIVKLRDIRILLVCIGPEFSVYQLRVYTIRQTTANDCIYIRIHVEEGLGINHYHPPPPVWLPKLNPQR